MNNDSSFFETKEITTKTNKDSLKNITTVLPSLKKGNKYIIQNTMNIRLPKIKYLTNLSL